MPGWFDTDGEEQDIRNVATIDHFLVNHSYLGCLAYKCYPSIVLVAIRADDDRLVGDGAKVPRMFRVLSKLNIVDKQRPNLLIILTRVLSVGRKNFKTRLKKSIETVEQLAYQYLEVEPAIVYVENDTEEYEELEEKKGDWTVLRDGTLQPKNVFEAMMQLTSEHKDEVGQEAIRLYFASRGSNNPLVRSHSSPDAVSRDQIRKWRAIIQQTFPPIPNNEVSRALQSYAQSHPQSFPPSSLYKLMEELSTNSLTHLDTLRTLSLDQLQRKLSPYNLSQLECQALMEGCAVRPPQWTHIFQHIGYGVNTGISSSPETETAPLLCFSPVFTVTGECCQEGELTIPTCMQVVIPIERRRVEWKRMEPAPQTDKRELANPVKYQFQISQCVRCIRLLSNQQQLIPHLSPAFKEAVAALPDSSVVEESQQMREEYQHFFNTYGHFVIVACECGGVVQGEVQLMEKDANDKQQIIKSYINNLLEKIEADRKDRTINFEEKMSKIENKKDSPPAVCWKGAVKGERSDLFYELENAALSWKGGLTPPGCTLHSLTHHAWMEWTASLHENPAPPDYSQLDMDTVLPIYELVALLDPLKRDQVEQAVNLINPEFGNSSFYILSLGTSVVSKESSGESVITEPEYISSSLCNRESLSRKHISETLQIALGGFPEDALCFRGSWDNYGTVNIRDVTLGDKILSRDPWWIRFTEVVRVNSDKEEENKTFNYIKITHQYGEIVIGTKHTILVKIPYKPPELILAKDIYPGSVIYYIDHVKRTTQKSIVQNISLTLGKGHYSLKQREEFSRIVVNQVVTGNAEAACFPGNASVTLKGGEKVRMDEVKIGDYVLSIHSSTGKPIYSKVYLWAHRDPHVTATFLHITHPHGHLHISASHLILSGEQRRPVPAGHLSVGDTIHSLLSPAATATAISVPVLHIHTCTQVGYYAPFTNNGLIVVDGIASSVYSQPSTRSHAHVCASVTGGLVEQFGMHRVGQCVMTPVRVGCKLCVGNLILTKQMDTTTHIHKYCQWLMKIYERFI